MKTNPSSAEAVSYWSQPQIRQREFLGSRHFTLWLFTLAALFLSEPRGNSAPPPLRIRTDRIIVKPKEGIPPSALALQHSRFGSRVLRAFSRIGNLQVIKLPAAANVSAVLAAYRKSGLVAYAEPDYILEIQSEPNDFGYLNGDLWNLKNSGQYGGVPGADIHAPEGWNIQNRADDIVVAVIDTGARFTHEDIGPNLWVNPGETGLDANGHDKRTNGIDDDGDGLIDDVHGINAIVGSGNPFDDHGHGTHVSGTIGADGNNIVGVVGVAWGVQIMPCKFVDASGGGTVSDAVTCIDYACSKGAKIINASWGGYSFTSAALRDAINGARDAGIIFVAAAGNCSNNNDANSFFPASYEYDNVIAVAATDRDDQLAWYSDFGATTVHLAAPGSPVYSCWNGSDSDYRYMEGTSTAVPHVVGACALVWQHFPTLTHQQVINRVLAGADPVQALAGKCVTGGRLNLEKALGPQPPPNITPLTIWVDDALPQGAVPHTEGGGSWSGEPWNWVTNNPSPFSGAAAHQSDIIAGIHEHRFENATDTLEIFTGDKLFTYVYLDPVNPPREVMIEWIDRCHEHRAFWGDNIINWAADGTSGRRRIGDLPPVGQWVRLEVPASSLGLEGATLKGMSFMLVDGKATWDCSGRSNP